MTEQIQNNVENESSSFDALSFAEQLYATIDAYRSQVSAKYNQLILSAPESPGGVGETKLNAFYRMIGLPAIADPSFVNQFRNNKAFKTQISQDGTINYFHSIENDSALDSELFRRIRNRNDQLVAPPDEARFAEFMLKPESIAAGLSDNSKRTSIFPLVVDAAVPIYPLNRRLAQSFKHAINGEDYIPLGSKVRLSRPLIDNIIYMRVKSNSDAASIAKLKEQLNQIIGLSTFDNDTKVRIQTDVQKSSLTFVDAAMRTRLLQILKSLSSRFESARKEVQELSTKISFTLRPVSNPKMRSAKSTSIQPEIKIYALDMEIAAIEAEIRNQNAVAFTLPTEQVKRRTEYRRLEHGIGTSNIVDDVLISQLNSLLTYEIDDLNRRLAEKQHERDEILTRIEQLKQQLMYYTGEFSGLSIFDVICVIYGLFAIETRYLLGLLNEDAQKLLKEDEFFRPADATIEALFNENPASVADSLKALEEKITEAFKIAEGFVSTQAKTQ
jgi:hypothetical protein